MGNKITPTSKNQKALNRPRFFNLIYFFDAQKTHSFKIPIQRFRIIFALVIISLGIGLSSLILSFYLYHKSQNLEHLRQSLTETIFNYQVKYENVYEKAYGDEQSAETEVADEMTEEEITSNSFEDDSASEASGDDQNSAANTGNDVNVEIAAVQISKETNSIDLKFDLKNLNTGTRSRGKIYAIAEYETLDGEKHFQTYPQSLQLDDNQKPISLANAVSYGIMRFKPVKISFNPPEDNDLIYKRIYIVAVGSNGAILEESRDINHSFLK